MIYLTGSTNARDEPHLIAAGVGLMIQPGNSYHLRVDRYPFHAIDIGLKWSEADPYLAWLELRDRDRCLFAVSPDVYPDAAASLARGLEYAPLIREMGFPAAVVDGTFVKYWRRKRAADAGQVHDRSGAEVARWIRCLDAERTLPGFTDFEAPSLPVHRAAALGQAADV